jgi:hypothetical protein
LDPQMTAEGTVGAPTCLLFLSSGRCRHSRRLWKICWRERKRKLAAGVLGSCSSSRSFHATHRCCCCMLDGQPQKRLFLLLLHSFAVTGPAGNTYCIAVVYMINVSASVSFISIRFRFHFHFLRSSRIYREPWTFNLGPILSFCYTYRLMTTRHVGRIKVYYLS